MNTEHAGLSPQMVAAVRRQVEPVGTLVEAVAGVGVLLLLHGHDQPIFCTWAGLETLLQRAPRQTPEGVR